MFRLDVDGLPAGVDRIRVAALDAYDGAHWTTTAEYRLAGAELPPDPLLVGDPQPAVTVHEKVTLSGLDGPFLPVIGRPVSVEAGGEPVGFDPASGTLVRTSSSPRATSYEVVSELGALTMVSDRSDLAGLRAAATPVLDPYRTLPPDVPPQLQNLALLWADLADSHPAELLALRDQLLQVRYDDSPDAPPGHSYGALLRMLTGEPQDREGYAEQFASAFALLARERGFATRVVVGYLLPEPEEDGSYVITEAQAHAWPEVNLVGVGWVAVEPTDLSQIGAAHDPADDVSDAPAEDPGPEGDLVDEPVEPRVIVPDATNSTGSGSRLREGAAVGGLLLLVALALVPILSVTVKANRRWRRRTGGRPSDRVVGAWQETVDRLTEHGVDVQPVADLDRGGGPHRGPVQRLGHLGRAAGDVGGGGRVRAHRALRGRSRPGVVPRTPGPARARRRRGRGPPAHVPVGPAAAGAQMAAPMTRTPPHSPGALMIASPDRGRRAAAATNPTPHLVPGRAAPVLMAPALGPPPAPRHRSPRPTSLTEASR